MRRSNILNGIMAKARVLSPKELARLCLAAGGGDAAAVPATSRGYWASSMRGSTFSVTND